MVPKMFAKMKGTFLLSILLISLNLNSQVYEFIKKNQNKVYTHKILIDDQYLVHTIYVKDPAEFILTRGGYYTIEGDTFDVELEFNSNFENDSIRVASLKQSKDWKNISQNKYDLEGKWLMSGRVSDDGTQNRRNIESPRKTMKFLRDGHFHWVAFHTETMRFLGCGGGTYKTKDRKYFEEIDYFSRDNSKVSLTLEFNYDTKGYDWFHKGYSTSGNPMHEIWTKRLK